MSHLYYTAGEDVEMDLRVIFVLFKYAPQAKITHQISSENPAET